MAEMIPFEFKQCVTILKTTGKRAKNLRELRDKVSKISDESIFHHMYQYFLEEQRLLEYTNDFARWIGEHLRERALAERLSNIDPYTFKSMAEIRDAITSILAEFMEEFPRTRSVLPGEEFCFNEALMLVSPIGTRVKNLAEFLMAMKYVDVNSIYFHFYEARIRLPEGTDDFSSWLGDSLNKRELAEKIRAIDPFMHSLEAVRAHITELVELELINDMERFEA